MKSVTLVIVFVTTIAVKSFGATITGTILYNSLPISQQTDAQASFDSFYNMDTHTKQDFSATYDKTTGSYSLTGFGHGTYIVWVSFDAASPFNGLFLPGDYHGTAQYIVVPTDDSIVEKDIIAGRIIHLTSPADNAFLIPRSPPLLNNGFLASWDPIPEATKYYVAVSVETPTCCGTVIIKYVTEPMINVVIPPRPSNEGYTLSIVAWSKNGNWVGELILYYSLEPFVSLNDRFPFRLCDSYDLMESELAHNIEIFGLGRVCTADLSGIIGVERTCPYIDNTTGLETTDTTISELNLKGKDINCGPITITLNQDMLSKGKVVEKMTGTSFPADSYFDVYIKINIPDLKLSLMNCKPATMHCTVNQLPPIGCVYQIGLDGGNFDVQLFPTGTDCTAPDNPIGQIIAADHTPTKVIYTGPFKPSPTPLHFYNATATPAAWEQLQPPYAVEKFNPEYPTAVIVHGWNVSNLSTLNDIDNGERNWMLQMADEIYVRLGNNKVNILAWDWLEAAKGDFTGLDKPTSKTPYQAIALSVRLRKLFDATSYPKEKDLHLLGSSLGAYLVTMAGYNLSKNSWHAPDQISLLDIADLERFTGVDSNPKFINSLVFDQRANYGVYFDIYHGVTSIGNHGCNAWIKVPRIGVNPIPWHYVYKWYQKTVTNEIRPLLYKIKMWGIKELMDGTLGFGMSPFSGKNRPDNTCDPEHLETLSFMPPADITLFTHGWDKDDFALASEKCTKYTPPTKHESVLLTQGSFSDDSKGEHISATSIRIKTASPVTFTLLLTIDSVWDYLSFLYDITSAPQKAELFVTLHTIENDTTTQLFYVASDEILDFGWLEAGPLPIEAFQGKNAELIFEWTSQTPDAIIEIKDVAFLTDSGHFAQKPKANAGDDRAILASENDQTPVILDGSKTASENNENSEFWWTIKDGFLVSGLTPEITLPKGGYQIQLNVRDEYDNADTDEVIIEVEHPFTRGDANADGQADITDAIAILTWLFLKTDQLPCADAADIDDNADVDLSDPINLLYFLFLGKAAPKPPYPTAGLDPTPDMLGCDIKLK